MAPRTNWIIHNKLSHFIKLFNLKRMTERRGQEEGEERGLTEHRDFGNLIIALGSSYCLIKRFTKKNMFSLCLTLEDLHVGALWEMCLVFSVIVVE